MKFATLFIALSLSACSAPVPPAAPSPEPAEPTVAVVFPARDDAAMAELAGARHKILQLENQLREQQGQIEAAYAEAERYETGLDKCVAKLNEVAADAATAEEYRPVAAAPARHRPAARVSTLSAPTISLVDNEAFVTVRLWNGGDGDASGSVTLELVCGGSVVDSSTQNAEITARTDQVVTATLHTIGADGNCSARASLDF